MYSPAETDEGAHMLKIKLTLKTWQHWGLTLREDVMIWCTIFNIPTQEMLQVISGINLQEGDCN